VATDVFDVEVGTTVISVGDCSTKRFHILINYKNILIDKPCENRVAV
jgi:hypothetical protein